MEKIKLDSDDEVQKMLEEWDKVKCVICGKTISMLEASTVYDGEKFICKKGKCYNE